jgi:hypothetical protein
MDVPYVFLTELKKSAKELWEVTFKVQGATKEKLLESVRLFFQDVIDLRNWQA